MFSDAKSFNQPIGEWDIGAATTLNSMFANASAFNQPIGEWCKKVGLMCFTPCRESDLMMVPGQSTFHQGTITVLRVFRERCRLADGQQTTSLAAQRGGVQQVNDVFHGLVRAACKGITALVQIFHFYLVVYDAPVIIDTQDKLGPNNCCKGKLNVSIKRNVDRIQNRCTCV